MAKPRTENLPLLPLRDVVIFPSVVTPLFVGREKSIIALQASMASDKQIMLITQKEAEKDDPAPEDLFQIGTIATILQLIKLPDGTVKVLVEGNKRANINKIESYEDYVVVNVSAIDEEIETEEAKKYIPSLRKNFQEYVKVTRKATPEVLSTVNSIDSLSRLTDTLVGHLSIDIKEKQKILETTNLIDRAEKILSYLASQLDLTKVEKRIRGSSWVSAAAAIRFGETRESRISEKPTSVFATIDSGTVLASNANPAPGWMRFTIRRPMATAMPVVQMK